MSSQHDLHRIKCRPSAALVVATGSGPEGQSNICGGPNNTKRRPHRAVRPSPIFLGNTRPVAEASEKQRMAGTEQ